VVAWQAILAEESAVFGGLCQVGRRVFAAQDGLEISASKRPWCGPVVASKCITPR
jgi:hypothetical protein